MDMGGAVRTITPKSWIALLCSVLLVLFLVLWSFFGSISTIVEGKGILISEDGHIYNVVAPEASSRVIRILPKQGYLIKKDQVVAETAVPDLRKQLQQTKNHYLPALYQLLVVFLMKILIFPSSLGFH